jgi:hypothetical protein
VKCRNARLSQGLLGHPPRHLVEVGAHQDERVLGQYATPGGVLPDDTVKMFQKTPVPATHLTDALGLLIRGAIENFHQDLVDLSEIRLVRATASRHVHPPIDQQLDTAVVQTWNPRVSKEQGANHRESGRVGNGDAVRGCNLGRAAARGGEMDMSAVAFNPAFESQEIEQAVEHIPVGRDRVKRDGPLAQLGRDAAARQPDHGRTDRHAIQMLTNLFADPGDGALRRVQAPARLGARNKLEQGWKDGLVGAAIEKVLKKDCFVEEGDDFPVPWWSQSKALGPVRGKREKQLAARPCLLRQPQLWSRRRAAFR